ncbi:MAG: tRNA (5-methylaminomethyl-2-thiouridine)(34)-methyltransferase MnmD [Prolixibacteraceae bacterium]|nr:tRNA (5-methylaminomethyl-2-thiouridine)(34)-methyltransferase MnmD [Prolixibacteraceae bacterium]
MTLKRHIVLTADGSYTIEIPEMNEHYHSVNGAITESEHVFINAGFKKIVQKDISILEVGFGTGLNALLTLETSLRENLTINYTGIEKYPLSAPEVKKLNYAAITDNTLTENFSKIHECKWNQRVNITPNFSIYKVKTDFRHVKLSSTGPFNLVYFDAFAPGKHPDLWTKEVFSKIFDNCMPGALFVTYCAMGKVRRNLTETGFRVERIPGPPGKREMLRAVKPR